jgi:hypothetical protein
MTAAQAERAGEAKNARGLPQAAIAIRTYQLKTRISWKNRFFRGGIIEKGFQIIQFN